MTGLHRYMIDLIERQVETLAWKLSDWAQDPAPLEGIRRKWWLFLDWLGWVFHGS